MQSGGLTILFVKINEAFSGMHIDPSMLLSFTEVSLKIKVGKNLKMTVARTNSEQSAVCRSQSR